MINAPGAMDNTMGFSYFGARYYDSDLSVWLSVDPMSDKYPSTSGYMYCLGNPVRLVDPTGMESDDWVEINGAMKYDSRVQKPSDATTLYGNGAIYRAPGYSYTANDGSRIKLYDHGYVTENIWDQYRSPDFAPKTSAMAIISSYSGNSSNDSWWANRADDADAVFSAIGDFIKRIDEGGHADGANTGRITKEDQKVGFAVVGIMSGGGILLTGGTTLTLIGAGAGVLNSADNVNFSEESISQSLTTDPNAKRNIGYAKFGLSCITLGTSLSNPSSIIKDPFTLFNTVGDGHSIGSSINDEISKSQK